MNLPTMVPVDLPQPPMPPTTKPGISTIAVHGASIDQNKVSDRVERGLVRILVPG